MFLEDIQILPMQTVGYIQSTLIIVKYRGPAKNYTIKELHSNQSDTDL